MTYLQVDALKECWSMPPFHSFALAILDLNTTTTVTQHRGKGTLGGLQIDDTPHRPRTALALPPPRGSPHQITTPSQPQRRKSRA